MVDTESLSRKLLQLSRCPTLGQLSPISQERLNAPFLNGLFSSGFSRRKTAP